MLRLYQYATCPYCQMVIGTMNNLGLVENKDFVLVEASQGTEGRDEVVNLGGMSQVPFLVDGDTKMYESGDIITYLRKKFF